MDPTKVVVREATPNDAQAVWENEKNSWLRSYPNSELGITADLLREALIGADGSRELKRIEQIRESIENCSQAHAVFVACHNRDLVGSVAPFIADDGRHRLGSFHVFPSFQGCGIGSKLFKLSLEWNTGHDVWVHVIAYNQSAIDYYRKRGFVKLEDSHITSPKALIPLSIPIIKMILPAAR